MEGIEDVVDYVRGCWRIEIWQDARTVILKVLYVNTKICTVTVKSFHSAELKTGRVEMAGRGSTFITTNSRSAERNLKYVKFPVGLSC